MPIPGYAGFTMPLLRLGFYVDGRWLKGGMAHPPARYAQEGPGAVLSMLGHSDIQQDRWLGGDVPLNLQPLSISFDMLLTQEADLEALESVVGRRAVDLWFDLPVTDQWSIADAASGQTTWKTSRKLPWDLAGVTTSTRPPKAWIDSTAQTVVFASPPGAGEVYVPTTGGYAEIETPAGITGTYLRLRYHPILRARVTRLELIHADHNDLRAVVEIEEVRERLFEVAA